MFHRSRPLHKHLHGGLFRPFENLISLQTRVPWTVRDAQWLLLFAWVGAALFSSPLFITQRLQPLEMDNITFCGQVSIYGLREDAAVLRRVQLAKRRRSQISLRFDFVDVSVRDSRVDHVGLHGPLRQNHILRSATGRSSKRLKRTGLSPRDLF